MAAKNEQAEQASAPEEGLSRQSQFSTVKENTDLPESNPPAGRQVIEERGKPKKGVVPAGGS